MEVVLGLHRLVLRILRPIPSLTPLPIQKLSFIANVEISLQIPAASPLKGDTWLGDIPK